MKATTKQLIAQSEGRRTNSLIKNARGKGFFKSAELLESIVPDRRKSEDFEYIRTILYVMENSILTGKAMIEADRNTHALLADFYARGMTEVITETMFEAVVAAVRGTQTAQLTLTEETTMTEPTTTPADPTSKIDNLAKSLAEFLVAQEQPTAKIDETRVAEIARDVVTEIVRENVRILEIKVNDQPTKKVSGVHEQFELALTVLAQRLNLMMVGGAGSGKTSLAHQAADALGLEFYSISCGPQTSKTDLMGYMDANGKYIPSLFRKAFENGGVFLFDEIDAANAAVLTIINAATANGQAGFPDAVVNKHENFVVCAAANTYGRGADRQYVGRQKLDEATLDRFVPIEVGYDKQIERAVAGGNDDWLTTVWKVRTAVEVLKVRHIVSTRAVGNGAKLLKAGVKLETVMGMTLWKGLDAETVKTIRAKAGV